MINSLFEKLKVRSILILLVSVPVLATVGASFSDLSSMLERRAETRELKILSRIAIAGGELVHELQKERGMSAGFLSSQGKAFASQLPEQRKLTDEKLTAFRDVLAGTSSNVDRELFWNGVAEALTRLETLEDRRASVNELAIPTGEAVAFYTGINTELLSNIFRLSNVSSNSRISRMANAYANFSSSKERAGIERAMFSVTFNLDRFTPANERRILQLINEQDLFIDLFRRTANAEQLADFDVVTQHPDYLETQRYRDLAFELREGFNVSSETWFATITGKIEQLYAMEGRLAAGLQQTAESEYSATTAALSGLGIAAIGFAIVTLLVATLVISKVTYMLGAEPRVLMGFASRIARGDLIERKRAVDDNATGLLASMHEMQSMLRERRDEEREQAELIARLTRSLDKISTNVLVADSTNQVIYSNEAIARYLAEFHADFAAVIPDFNPGDLKALNLSMFDAAVKGLNQEHPEFDIEKTFGGRVAQLIFNAVYNDDGERVGSTLEIKDITDERQVVEEVSSVIASAANGDLGRRVATAGRDGVLLTLSESINNMLQVTEEVVADVAGALEALAKGDLTHSTGSQYDGSFANLMSNASQTVENLTSVVSRIKQSTESVETASEAISAGARDLSDRTERAAGSIMDTSSRVRDLSETVKSNADRAAEATSLVYGAREDAKSGGQVVDEAIEAMQNINASSTKIAEIIGVIDEIAFQTNLLALNASVEAARAGEQGRGFAVVASEVRNLASRCAKAAQEVKEIIERSIQEVSQGSELVNRTGEKLHEIVSGVQNVSSIVDEIAEASQIQAMSVTSIRSTVEDLDDNTQQNAALVEETSSATESTMAQLRNLNELMRFFTVRTGEAANSNWTGDTQKRA